jgi:hypothetical protein
MRHPSRLCGCATGIRLVVAFSGVFGCVRVLRCNEYATDFCARTTTLLIGLCERSLLSFYRSTDSKRCSIQVAVRGASSGPLSPTSCSTIPKEQATNDSSSVEGRFIYRAALSKHSLPFATIEPPTVVPPIEERHGTLRVRTAKELIDDGFRKFGKPNQATRFHSAFLGPSIPHLPLDGPGSATVQIGGGDNISF